MRSLALIIFSCFLISCNEQVKDNTPIKAEIVKKNTEIDSTNFFDSLYAPLAYKIDTFFTNKFNATTFNGTVLYGKRNHVITKKAYGFSTRETKDSLTTKSTFQLASASKPFTAIACLQLIENGKLNLTDTINQYIENLPYKGITIHQLLSHRSGLSQYTHFCDRPDSIWPDKHKTITNEDVISIIANYQPPYNYLPNTHFYYCNTNYLLLASIIEKVSGEKFENYLKNHIFLPLGMNSTVVYNRENKADLINPVRAYNGAYNPYIDIYLNGVVGDKGVYSNVEDLFKFYKGLRNGILISKEHLELAITPKNEKRLNGRNYGYGFRLLAVSDNENIVFHTGWWKGFRTYFMMNQNLDEVGIVLTNLKRGPFLSVKDLMELVKN